MNKNTQHKQVISEIKKLRNVLLEAEVDKSTHVNANSVRSHLQSLGYKVKPTLDEVGDITPEFASVLKKVSSAFKKEIPDLEIRFGSGRDKFHQTYPNSRHNKGNANDIVFDGVRKSDDEMLDKICTLLCAARKSIPGFTFIDEYRHPTPHSTGEHFHISYSENKNDESRFTPKFCSSVNVLNLDSFEFPEILDDEIIDKKDPDKLEKFLDKFGISALSDIEIGNKESQKKLLSMIDDIDIIDTKDGLKIFGYSVDDILEKIKGLLPVFESEKEKKNILEDIKKIKSKMIK